MLFSLHFNMSQNKKDAQNNPGNLLSTLLHHHGLRRAIPRRRSLRLWPLCVHGHVWVGGGPGKLLNHPSFGAVWEATLQCYILLSNWRGTPWHQCHPNQWATTELFSSLFIYFPLLHLLISYLPLFLLLLLGWRNPWFGRSLHLCCSISLTVY